MGTVLTTKSKEYQIIFDQPSNGIGRSSKKMFSNKKNEISGEEIHTI